jgi:predicted phage baseplate assembly protein
MTVLGPTGTSARRAELLDQLITFLTSPGATVDGPLAIRDLSLADPLIALLDAWATAADVIGFYLDRIADEGYLASAQDPGSVLALAGLLGQAAQPGLAASTSLAYQLQPDPNDAAVTLPAGLLAQSVPATGQQPQTFETTQPLTARPSWGLLSPRALAPLTLPAGGPGHLTSIVIEGTKVNLQPNDTLLLDVAGHAEPVAVNVASATVDLAAQETTVALMPSIGASGPAEVGAAAVENAMDALVQPLDRLSPFRPQEITKSAPTPLATFGAGADSTVRIMTALRPALSSSLYPALSTSTIGQANVTGAAVCQVVAAPFGAVAPPRQLTSGGTPLGTADWPIGRTQHITVSMSADDAIALLLKAAVALGYSTLAARLSSLHSAAGTPSLDVTFSGETVTRSERVEISGSGPWGSEHLGIHLRPETRDVRFECSLGEEHLSAWVTLDSTGAVGLDVRTRRTDGSRFETEDSRFESEGSRFESEGSFVWDPTVRRAQTAMLGNVRLTVDWEPPHAGVGQPETLTLTFEIPLPLRHRDILQLDRVYSGILSGTHALIRRASSSGGEASTTIANIRSVDTVAASAYGLTGEVTQLKLDRHWIAERDLYQSSLREITVLAQPTPLQVAPVPVTADVAGGSIDLSSLVAGMESGRLIAITGNRTDLPNDATVPAGELARVAQVLTQTDSEGSTPYATLALSGDLSYSYERSSVKIYGNVVPARQGATLTEVLGSGDPAVDHQTFTLSSGPLLADPGPGSSGATTTLVVTVDGVPYNQVGRIDASTPALSFVLGSDPAGRSTVTFARPLPRGSGNVGASYRVGDGTQGNVVAGQVSQLLSKPSEALSVTNPLPGTGGAPGTSLDELRAAIPTATRGLGRLVTVSDYADMATSWAGVAKAAAQSSGDGVVLTVAGPGPVPLDPSGGVVSGLTAAVSEASDPNVAVTVVPAQLYLIVLVASIRHDRTVAWDGLARSVRSALTTSFSYENRRIGQDVVLSEIRAAAHSVAGVQSFEPSGLVLIPATAAPSELSSHLRTLLAVPPPEVLTLASADARWARAGASATATGADTTVTGTPGIAFLSSAVPDTLLLQEEVG